MNKFYINITNKCDYECPFCCMYSSYQNSDFMSFDILYNIIKRINEPTIIQLEGGEPLIHPQFILFLEYLSTIELVSEIIIDTNSVHLEDLIDSIINISERNKKYITIKPSYNTYLKNKDFNLQKRLNLIISACEFLEYIKFEINIRAYNKKELDSLCNEMIGFKYNAHLFNKYGRASNNNELKEPFITNEFDYWQIFSCDGNSFGNNLKERSEYEYFKISTNKRKKTRML